MYPATPADHQSICSEALWLIQYACNNSLLLIIFCFLWLQQCQNYKIIRILWMVQLNSKSIQRIIWLIRVISIQFIAWSTKLLIPLRDRNIFIQLTQKLTSSVVILWPGIQVAKRESARQCRKKEEKKTTTSHMFHNEVKIQHNLLQKGQPLKKGPFQIVIVIQVEDKVSINNQNYFIRTRISS